MKQSGITKESLARTLELARKMSWHRLIVSGPLPVQGNNEMYCRFTSLKRWLARYSWGQDFGFVDNWPVIGISLGFGLKNNQFDGSENIEMSLFFVSVSAI